MSNAGYIQKNCIQISLIHGSSDNGSLTNSGQCLKWDAGLIFTEIVLHFWESIALAGVSLGFVFLQHHYCILSCASNFCVCVCSLVS